MEEPATVLQSVVPDMRRVDGVTISYRALRKRTSEKAACEQGWDVMMDRTIQAQEMAGTNVLRFASSKASRGHHGQRTVSECDPKGRAPGPRGVGRRAHHILPSLGLSL